MSIYSGDIVCVLPTYVTVGCTSLPRYSVHQGPAIQYIMALSSWLNNVFRHQNPDDICKLRFFSRPQNISGFEDCWGIAAKFELEDLFQLAIPSSCCDEPLKQQLWVDLYYFIVDYDSWCTECDSLVFFLKLCCNAFCCAIDVKIFSPTYFAVSTLTLMPALIPVAMLRKLQLSLNGFRDSRHSSYYSSLISFRCLAVVKSLCCSRVVLYTSKLLHDIIYLSANRVRHQPDVALGFGHATTCG